MRALVVLLACAAAFAPVVSLAPAAHAEEEAEALCIIFIRPSQDFGVLEIAADLILSPEQRANLSARVDVDKDGTIGASEVETYQNETRMNYDGAVIPDERRMLLDDAPATSLDVRTKLRNWTGPRAEAEKGVVTEERYYRFDAYDGTEHTLEGALYVRPIPTHDPQVAIETIVIDAPAEWRIARVVQSDANGNRINETFPEAESYRISGFDLSRGSIVFRHASVPRVVTSAPPPATPTSPVATPIEVADPAPGAFAALAILAVVALVAARRRP